MSKLEQVLKQCKHIYCDIFRQSCFKNCAGISSNSLCGLSRGPKQTLINNNTAFWSYYAAKSVEIVTWFVWHFRCQKNTLASSSNCNYTKILSLTQVSSPLQMLPLHTCILMFDARAQVPAFPWWNQYILSFAPITLLWTSVIIGWQLWTCHPQKQSFAAT